MKIGDAKVALFKEYAQNWGSITDEQALLYVRRSQDVDVSVARIMGKICSDRE